MLAGLSTGYYMRLEQSRDHRPSEKVLQALARALQLDDDATDQLFALSRPGRPLDEIPRAGIPLTQRSFDAIRRCAGSLHRAFSLKDASGLAPEPGHGLVQVPGKARPRRAGGQNVWVPGPQVAAPEPFRSFAERIVGQAEAEPDRILISESGRALCGGEFARLVARLARALEACGLSRGMRVAILAPISPEALAVRYAAATIGCATVFCPNPGDSSRLREFLEHVGAHALVVFPESAARAATAVAAGSVGSVMSVGAVAAVDVDLLALSATLAADPVAGQAAGEELGVLVSSGGTTGSSKASRRSFAAYGRMVDAGPTPDRRQLVCTPLAYVAQVLVDQALTGGGSVVMLDRFDPAEVLRTIAAQRITHRGLVEPALVELIDHPEFAATDLSSLVAISHIGANAPASLRRRLLKRAGPVLAHPYGASEAGIISVLAAPEYDVTHPQAPEHRGPPAARGGGSRPARRRDTGTGRSVRNDRRPFGGGSRWLRARQRAGGLHRRLVSHRRPRTAG